MMIRPYDGEVVGRAYHERNTSARGNYRESLYSSQGVILCPPVGHDPEVKGMQHAHNYGGHAITIIEPYAHAFG